MKRMKKKYELAIHSICLAILLFSGYGTLEAETCEKQCSIYTDSDQYDTCEKKCEDLNDQIHTYKGILQIKDKQKGLLQSQLDSIDQAQKDTVAGIQNTQKTLEELGRKIDSLDQDIIEKEKTISSQRKILAGLMQSYYEYDQQGTLDVVMADQDFSTTFAQSDNIEQSGVKITDILETITEAKQDLIKNKEEISQKKDAHDQAKQDLLDKKDDLEATESQKQSLLAQTQGEEEKYKQLLANVEEQKKDLFDFSTASNLDEIENSVGSYDKPSSNLASTSWYFSQKDSRWGSKTIGNSKSLMKDWGCAVTSVAMVFRKMGSSIDPGKMAKQKIFYSDLINWPDSWSPDISLASSVSHGNVSWSTIDSKIKKGIPVIVYIKKTNGGGHYVVITGKDSKDYIVHDPYFGPNLYLGTSRSLVGKIGTDSKTSIDQMIVYQD